MYEWLVFLHVAAVLAFLLLHGAHVAAMWKMRAEADPEVSLTLFRSMSTAPWLRIVLAAVVGTGVLVGFMGDWWDRGWMWASLAILVAIWAAMWRYGGGYFGLVNDAATNAIEARASAAGDSAAQEAFDVARRSWYAPAVMAIGLGGLALLLWLMVFKPF